MQEGMAGIVAFVGVVFVARPTFLFPPRLEGSGTSDSALALAVPDHSGGIVSPEPIISPAERTLAVLCAILGSLGAATAYATIRVIGKRAHALVSVNYFAVLATVGSVLIILVHPQLQFQIPHGVAQWYNMTPSHLTALVLTLPGL